jgi:uncharacterized protein DUF4136
MQTATLKVRIWVMATAIALTAQTLMAIDVKVDFDKAFDFKGVRTWGWNPEVRGYVKMARTPDDDPDAMQKRAEPIIVSAVEAEMAKRSVKFTSDTPDVLVTYYLLLTLGTNAQTIGQFLPSVTQWGVPPFLASTQSIEMVNHGSLVLDFTSKKDVIWRGVAQANIKVDTDVKRREALIREAIRDLVRRFPPRT